MVLLKNDGILPLTKAPKSIAVVGPAGRQHSRPAGKLQRHAIPLQHSTRRHSEAISASEVTFVAGTHFLRDPKPIPADWFTTRDGKAGLEAEYFKGTDLQGAPVVTRVDKNVAFNFIRTPVPGFESGAFKSENFSARWTGFMTPSESGNYHIGVKADDGFRLWIDGKLIAEDWSTHGVDTKLADFQMEKGRKYAIKLEYFQTTGDAIVQLVWSTDMTKTPIEDAVAAARKSDIVIAVVGITSDLEGEEMKVKIEGFEGGDRTSLDLPKEEEALLEAIRATGKPLIVVLMNGSALSVNWANQHANAILEAWYAGEEGGTAIAQTLAGVNNPAGRLPVTFYKDVADLPPFDDYSMSNRTYRYYKGTPLYPFGYGLSYSRFAYDNLKFSPNQVQAGSSLTLDADVKNISQRDGDEVVRDLSQLPQCSWCSHPCSSRVHASARWCGQSRAHPYDSRPSRPQPRQ